MAMFKKQPLNDTNMELIEVKQSGIHNKGVFATQDIPKGEKIVEYLGEIVTSEEGSRRSEEQQKKGMVYIFKINSKRDIDGDVPYNIARLINHSCSPNCEAEQKGEQIFICALKNIKKGEELTFDYNFGMDNYEDHPCRCGAPNCVGYIVGEKYWPKLKELIAKKLKNEEKAQI